MDAANVDLKGFSEEFYHRLCTASLAAVLDTLKYIRHETNCWLEITTLLIPGENDSDQELHALSEWVFGQLGPDVPLHFTAFHPDYKMRDKAHTPHATLIKAHEIARASGLSHVYVGNVRDRVRASTYCANCGERLIGRDGYVITDYKLDGVGVCLHCGTRLAGVFDDAPGHWGARRLPVRMASSGTMEPQRLRLQLSWATLERAMSNPSRRCWERPSCCAVPCWFWRRRRAEHPDGQAEKDEPIVSSERTINLTEENRYIIREIVLKDPNVPKAQGTRAAIGDLLPPGVATQSFPTDVSQKMPALRSYRFFVTDEEVVIVDPKSNKVADIVKSQ